MSFRNSNADRLGTFIDATTILIETYCLLNPADTTNAVAILIAFSLAIFASEGSLTKRWPLTLPMIPYLFFQMTRRTDLTSSFEHSQAVLCFLSFCSTATGAILCFFFPPLRFPKPEGKLDVGVVDFYLPRPDSEGNGDFLSVRMFYPARVDPKNLPAHTAHLDPELGDLYCESAIRFGAPPPLRNAAWMLHGWKSIRIPAYQNAPPRDDGGLPIVVFSHGLHCDARSYSFLGMNLAANGSAVIMLNHGDGSAPVVKNRDGSRTLFDFSVGELSKALKEKDHIRSRRCQTKKRTEEIISTVSILLGLNGGIISPTDSLNVKLNTDKIVLMGHSFGGASVLSAAARNPELFSTVITFDPAIDWMTDQGRRALFAETKLKKCDAEYGGGAQGYESDSADPSAEEKKESDAVLKKGDIHDVNMLFLYSEFWMKEGWSNSRLIKTMHQKGQLGPSKHGSEIGVIAGTKHSEFSDVCMLTPTWLGRAIGLIGKCNPVDVLYETAAVVNDFLKREKAE